MLSRFSNRQATQRAEDHPSQVTSLTQGEHVPRLPRRISKNALYKVHAKQHPQEYVAAFFLFSEEQSLLSEERK